MECSVGSPKFGLDVFKYYFGAYEGVNIGVYMLGLSKPKFIFVG
jgi:hypothetical protein